MKIIFYSDGDVTNFGDDLNRWLWTRLLGSPLDTEDGVLALGIGTIISRRFVPVGKKYIVLGSGAGYDAPPQDFAGPSWKILGVRGPLTAAVLGLPPEAAVTDGAALLRLLPECQPISEAERSGIVFMPHYVTLATGNWKQVCEMAGMEFLDPREPSERTIQRIRKAKLVIADAMHAAVVADVVRVPWIPVVLSPHTNTFKWLDWTLSLGLSYQPVKLCASTLLESVNNSSLRLRGARFHFENRTFANAVKRFNRLARLRSWKHWPRWSRLMSLILFIIPKRILTLSSFKLIRKRQDQIRSRRAADKLKKIAEGQSWLSDERVFEAKLEQLSSLLEHLKPSLSVARFDFSEKSIPSVSSDKMAKNAIAADGSVDWQHQDSLPYLELPQ